MKWSLPQTILLGVLSASLLLPLAAQSPDLLKEARDMVRITRHPDGARAVYERKSEQPGMRCSIYSREGKLVAINHYIEGRYGQLVGCRIYDSSRKIIYKVSYGYDRNARLIEERMYSNPIGTLVQRVIYKYDEEGNRSKPIIISLNSGGQSAGKLKPTMQDDVNAIHKTKR